MTDHQKLLCSLLSADDVANAPLTTLDVMAVMNHAGAGHQRALLTRPLATSGSERREALRAG